MWGTRLQWDDAKNRENNRKHGLSFEAAQYVFADSLALSRIDPFPDEERWQTIGLVGQLTVFVESSRSIGRNFSRSLHLALFNLLDNAIHVCSDDS